jgi:hypothetical protein
LVAQKNIPAVFEAIVDGAVPEKFTVAHLKALGFGSSNDRGFLPLLKELGFLSSDGTPTQRYRDYRDRTRSRRVLGDAIRDVYGDLFLINELGPGKSDREAIEGRFRSTHASNDHVASLQAATYLSLKELADFGKSSSPLAIKKENPTDQAGAIGVSLINTAKRQIDFRYTIEVHLPATKDQEVYNAIFRSMKEHLLDE